jgi:16S rRNA (cytidine1402-2'-O)-methyltransferase
MTLYIVATPIGNLKDITLRALDVLRDVDIIAAEDTRVSRKLLMKYDIRKTVLAYHEHSSEKIILNIVNLLLAGKNIAYIVDAGTPGISDPGNYLVRKVSELTPEVSIIPIPGPSALTAAISISGLQGSSFLFLGFPPHKKGRRVFFEQVVASKHPVVLYESPYRILRTLKDLSDIGLSMFECVLIKEISKVYERILRMSIDDLQKEISKEKKIRGEFVLVINKKT